MAAADANELIALTSSHAEEPSAMRDNTTALRIRARCSQLDGELEAALADLRAALAQETKMGVGVTDSPTLGDLLEVMGDMKRGDARPHWGGIDARRDLERELGLGMYAIKFCGVCKAVNSKMKMCGKVIDGNV